MADQRRPTSNPKVRRIAIVLLALFGLLNLFTGSWVVTILCAIWIALLLLQAWVHARRAPPP